MSLYLEIVHATGAPFTIVMFEEKDQKLLQTVAKHLDTTVGGMLNCQAGIYFINTFVPCRFSSEFAAFFATLRTDIMVSREWFNFGGETFDWGLKFEDFTYLEKYSKAERFRVLFADQKREI